MSHPASTSAQQDEHNDCSNVFSDQEPSAYSTPGKAPRAKSPISTASDETDSEASVGSLAQTVAPGWQGRLENLGINAVNWAVSRVRAALDGTSQSSQSEVTRETIRRDRGSDLYCRRAAVREALLEAPSKIIILVRIEEVAWTLRDSIMEHINETGVEEGFVKFSDACFSRIELLARLAEQVLYPGQTEGWFYRGWWTKTGGNLRAMNQVLDEQLIRKLFKWFEFCRASARAQLDEWNREGLEKEDARQEFQWEVVDQQETTPRTPSVFPVRTRRHPI